MIFPTQPPKPRITIASEECVLLDNGHATVILDTWQEAVDLAERIRRDYRERLAAWLHMRAAHAPVTAQPHVHVYHYRYSCACGAHLSADGGDDE